jgi:hypothetical protein
LNILGLPEKNTDYAQLLLEKQLTYMDYQGKMKGLSSQFDTLKSKHPYLSINRSVAESIIDAYQYDFKIHLYK